MVFLKEKRNTLNPSYFPQLPIWTCEMGSMVTFSDMCNWLLPRCLSIRQSIFKKVCQTLFLRCYANCVDTGGGPAFLIPLQHCLFIALTARNRSHFTPEFPLASGTNISSIQVQVWSILPCIRVFFAFIPCKEAECLSCCSFTELHNARPPIFSTYCLISYQLRSAVNQLGLFGFGGYPSPKD